MCYPLSVHYVEGEGGTIRQRIEFPSVRVWFRPYLSSCTFLFLQESAYFFPIFLYKPHIYYQRDILFYFMFIGRENGNNFTLDNNFDYVMCGDQQHLVM